MSIYGPQWPLSKGEKDLYKMNESRLEQARFEIKNLLLTSKGENLSDPNYGIGIRRYIFEMNNPSIRATINREIRIQMIRYMDNIKFISSDIQASADDIDSNSLRIFITFSELGKEQEERMEIVLNDDNGNLY
jgi:phage baseplate assembly protein W